MSPAPPDSAMLSARHKTRITAALFCFMLWCLVILIRLSQCMVFERDPHLAHRSRRAIFEGLIPAPRGRLLDRDGTPLAWSLRRFTLTWNVPADTRAARLEAARLRVLLPPWAAPPADISGRRGGAVVLGRNLPPAKAAELAPLCAKNHALKLDASFVRQRCADREIARRLGRVVKENGVEIGVSGLEETHDAFLRGRPGIFRVMVDKWGRWMPETWEKIRDMKPGYDVYLPVRADSLGRRKS